MFKAWPLNAFGLRQLQTNIAKEINVDLGTLTTISNSSHIYENDWKETSKIIEKNYKLICKVDPRGNLIINIENKKIKVTRVSPEGLKLNEYFANNAKAMYELLEKELTMSQTHHAIYLGTELAKAEIALNNNLEYIQDQALKINKE